MRLFRVPRVPVWLAGLAEVNNAEVIILYSELTKTLQVPPGAWAIQCCGTVTPSPAASKFLSARSS